jgi:hypothetical protein
VYLSSLHVLVPNTYSELDTEGYECLVEGSPVRIRHQSCEGYKAQPGLRPSMGRRGLRGRRINDLIKIWGGFRQLDESSKALMGGNKVST